MKASDIAKQAAELISGDRDRQHGDKATNFQNIATMWNAYLTVSKKYGRPLEARDVGNMMALLKMSRQFSGDFNADDFIDCAGYVACAGEIAAREDEKSGRLRVAS